MAHTVESIRAILCQHKGARISYRASHGRRKMEEKSGVIREIYPSLFTVYIEAQDSIVSFSYADILTREVELSLLENNGEELF